MSNRNLYIPACFTIAACLLALACPASAYVVYFKNGSTMEVAAHRVEGGKVYLKMKSGEAAFDKDQFDLVKTQADYDAYKLVLDKGKGLLDKGDFTSAVELYKTLTSKDSVDVQVRYMLGRALAGAKKYEEAIYEFRRVQELDPAWPYVRTRLGEIYYKQGNYYEAIDQFLLALDEDAKDKEAHLGLGMCYAKQEMFEGAKTELTKAIELRPGYSDAYSMLGYVYYKKSDFTAALDSLDRAVAGDPNLPDAYYYMGLVYGVLGVEAADSKKRLDFFDKSIESFRKAVTLRYDFPEAHADLGVAFYNRGSAARAVEEFNIALTQKPDMAVTHNNLAGVYNRRGFYEEAVAEAKKAVAIDPRLVEAYFVMGNAYANMRKFKEAAGAYDRYLYYSPDGDLSEEVRQRLDRVEQEGGLTPTGSGQPSQTGKSDQPAKPGGQPSR